MRKALVTLAIGKKYIRRFSKSCRHLWKDYAEKNNFDLIVITEALDNSPKAQSRSPAWQKCLILSNPDIQRYDRVVWVDSDILINPGSPDICKNVPIDKVGAVDSYATPNREDYRLVLERLYEHWSRNGIPFINELTATDFHRNFGLDEEFESVVQTGVIVLSPKYHRELLESVYHNYEDKGPAYWNYEMRPLSYEILKNKCEFWLPPKFNMPWPLLKGFHYPFLMSRNNLFKKVLYKVGVPPKASLITKCATTAFLNNYFLHFCGSSGEMKYVNTQITSVSEI